MAYPPSISSQLSHALGASNGLAPEQVERLGQLSPALLLVADPQLRLTFTSVAFQRAVGADAAELTGRNWLELLHAEDLADAGRALDRAREAHLRGGGVRGPHLHPGRRLAVALLDGVLRERPLLRRRPGRERPQARRGRPRLGRPAPAGADRAGAGDGLHGLARCRGRVVVRERAGGADARLDHRGVAGRSAALDRADPPRGPRAGARGRGGPRGSGRPPQVGVPHAHAQRAGALGARRRQRDGGRDRRAPAPRADARRDRPEAGRAGDAGQRAQVPQARGDLPGHHLGHRPGEPLHLRERRGAHHPRL